jgi:CO/xanthine dehydrogenase Mo-binding subunit
MKKPPPGKSRFTINESSISEFPGAQIVWIKNFLAVVAPKEWNAIRAAQKLQVTWSESHPNFPGNDKLHEHIRSAPVIKRFIQAENGHFEDGLKQAVRVIEGEYEYPTQSHASTGPCCGLADVREGEATVWTSTQKPHYARDGIAELVGLPKDKVRAVWMFGTGSYGRNDQGDATADAAVLSQRLKRPVRPRGARLGPQRDGIDQSQSCRYRCGRQGDRLRKYQQSVFAPRYRDQ